MTSRRRGWLLAAAACAALLLPRPADAKGSATKRLRVVSFNTAMGVVVKLRSEQGLRALFEDEPALRRAQVLSLQEVCLNDRRQLALYLSVIESMHGVQYHYADYASTKHDQAC